MKRIVLYITVLFTVVGMVAQGEGAIVSVTGDGSIIAPPAAAVVGEATEANSQQGFDEQQGVLLLADLDVDGGIISAGKVVDSHMIFLNPVSSTLECLATWTFDGDVIGVMSDRPGSLEAASNTILGAINTEYPVAYFGRGMEIGLSGSPDYYNVSSNTLEVNIYTSKTWGDWIRVITVGVLEVEIDIKPGSYPNSINLGSQGVIPVAIISSDIFDATQVDPSTIVLEGASVAVRGKGEKYMAHAEDVNGDELVDLTIQLDAENFSPGVEQDGEACLTGMTYDGIEIIGCDEIRIVPPE